MDRSSKQDINKHIAASKNVLDQMNLTVIYRAFHTQRSKIHILFKCTWNISKIDHMIGHKTSLNKFKKIEMVHSIFSDHKGLKLETILKEKNSKTLKFMEIE